MPGSRRIVTVNSAVAKVAYKQGSVEVSELFGASVRPQGELSALRVTRRLMKLPSASKTLKIAGTGHIIMPICVLLGVGDVD